MKKEKTTLTCIHSSITDSIILDAISSFKFFFFYLVTVIYSGKKFWGVKRAGSIGRKEKVGHKYLSILKGF